ncbi:hypothetical protein GHW02_28100, partial [Pseudomonas aeruginosa]|nr:hypothetical protein [Pseudomonas aeruginosa]
VKQVQVLQAALLELQDLQAGARLLLSLNALAVGAGGPARRRRRRAGALLPGARPRRRRAPAGPLGQGKRR